MSDLTQKSTAKELWEFARTRKKFWLLPIVIVILTMAALLLLVEGSALSPFVYTIF